MRGIAKLWKPVINVTDLDEGERFWSAVSGLPPAGRHGEFLEYSVLDDGNLRDGYGWILLQLVPTGQAGSHGGTHLDFRVDDVAGAASEIEAIGGVTIKSAAIYPSAGKPLLEWAIMQDPFGNEFCLVKWPLS